MAEPKLTTLQSEVLFRLWLAEIEGRTDGLTIKELGESLKLPPPRPADPNAPEPKAFSKDVSPGMLIKTVAQLRQKSKERSNPNIGWQWDTLRAETEDFNNHQRRHQLYSLAQGEVIRRTLTAYVLVWLRDRQRAHGNRRLMLSELRHDLEMDTQLAYSVISPRLSHAEKKLYIIVDELAPGESELILQARFRAELPYIRNIAAYFVRGQDIDPPLAH